jgi:hypothetical protein
VPQCRRNRSIRQALNEAALLGAAEADAVEADLLTDVYVSY